MLGNNLCDYVLKYELARYVCCLSSSADTEDGISIFKAQSEEPFPSKKRGWFSRGAHERRKRMRKLQQQRVLAAANREVNAQT
ncbi:hypothetical protein Hanom_Chr04g00317061 [Helianthus anomalus]